MAQSNDGIVISQRKYDMDILEETGLVSSMFVDTPMDPNTKLLPNQGEPISDPEQYRRLVGKLNYLTITRTDISFAVSVVSNFLIPHVKYIKRSLEKDCYMVLITIQELFAIQMLIGQDLLLIEALHLSIVSPLVVT